MMKKLLGLVFNRWLLLALLLAALSLLLWIAGPLLAFGEARPLESERQRWTAIAALWGLAAALAAFGRWRARRGNAAVVQQLVQAPAEAGPRESADLAAVRQQFERALQALARMRFGAQGPLKGWAARLGGRHLYQLPWYVIIGAPGAGKTTALRHSGLNFPLADLLGGQAPRGIGGVGGTRHCDWWFTDRAVLVDTAGRFTTQDSDPGTDQATWDGFLQLLRRSRPRQPINGVLVAVSASDLLAPAAQRAAHALTVRARLQELHERLGIAFPVYLLVTKADLLAGFMDYFATLDKAERAAPWGFTFPREGAAPLAALPAEFDALRQRLLDGLVERLQAERDPARRARIYGFPVQFAGLREALQTFAEDVFAPSALQAQPLLRGVYFISGTQEGAPIDRVLGSVARRYRLEHAVLAPQQASGRSYFLQRLLDEVVFAEAGLAGTRRGWARRQRLLLGAGYAAVGLLAVGLAATWWRSYADNRRYVDDVAARAGPVQQLLAATPNRASPDLLPLLPALQATRALAQPAEGGAGGWRGFGLSQQGKLDSAAQAAYRRMLADALLPRLALRVEEQLRQSAGSPEPQYEALKVYVMLHEPAHFSADDLRRHVQDDWDTTRRELTPAQREQLQDHLDSLLEQGGVASPLPADAALLKSVRAQLAAQPLAQRVYARLRSQGLGQDFPAFSVARAAGPGAALVFTRASGVPLTQGVPGLYTRDGYLKGFQKQVGQVADQLAAEQPWVLAVADAPRDAAARLRAPAPLVDEVRRLYLADYAATWEAFIADIKLQPMGQLGQSVQMSRLLSAPDSPLPPLLKGIARETTLGAGGGAVETAEQRAQQFVRESQKKLAGLVSGAATGAPAGPAQTLEEQLVDSRFAGLRHFVTPLPGGRAPLDDTLALVAEVNLLLTAVQTALQGGAAPPPSPLPNRVKAEAARMPQPLRTMMETLSQGSAQIAQGLMRQNLAQEVRSQVGEFCQQAVAGRYPLVAGSPRDVTQADFATLFGPGGKIDQVFQSRLAPYVDTSTRPWRFRAVEGTPLGADAGTLPQFQRAAAIRETFFPGAGGPALRLDFKPIEMDATIQQFILDVDGQIVRYAHGPQIPTAVQWPGPRGSSEVRVQLSPPSASGASGLVDSGPWALLRLFDRVQIEPTGAPERFRATFDVGGRKAVFEVTASSVRNPFRLRELREFACPAGL
ncbi:type VI secretion system membrane subunit TssM [Pseudorhodoferax sp.]|uniref:type VI secretion system membrane subunit TssM n=1 Tax=Pseudorhodoferax sp. TaxID=1993553 RepID=UPI0039E61057